MEIRLKIDDIDYGELAAALLPQLKTILEGRTDSVSRILAGVMMLPPVLIKKTINALPQETQEEMVKYLINAKSDSILEAAEKYMQSRQIPLHFSSISIE